MQNAAKALIAMMVLASLAACNTVEGVGEDLEKAGDHIEKRAEELNPDNR